MKQQYSSKDTCINTVSKVYKLIDNRNSVILDYGGGKYDTNHNYMMGKCNTKVMVYDPYNRSREHNDSVMNYFINHPPKIVVCSNVLNVIKEDDVIMNILTHIYTLMREDSKLYIKVYERERNGIGCVTSKGWQRNMKTNDYIPYIREVFGKRSEIAKVKDCLVITKKVGMPYND